jgi:branched-chain amino acid transport system substrate-binding protein
MAFRTISIGVAAAALLGGATLPALAQDSIYVPLFTYRTGPFAGSGIHIADGMHDYLSMRNARPATTPRRASSATSR